MPRRPNRLEQRHVGLRNPTCFHGLDAEKTQSFRVINPLTGDKPPPPTSVSYRVLGLAVFQGETRGLFLVRLRLPVLRRLLGRLLRTLLGRLLGWLSSRSPRQLTMQLRVVPAQRIHLSSEGLEGRLHRSRSRRRSRIGSRGQIR